MNLSRLFAGHIFWRGFYLITSMLVTILMARYLQATATGWVFFFISWLSFFFLAATLGMDASVTYFVSGRQISPQVMLLLASGWVLVAGLLTWLAATVLIRTGNEFMERAALVKAAVFFITGNLLITFLNALYYASRDFITPNVLFTGVNLLLAAWLLTRLPGKPLQLAGYSFLEVYFFSFFLQGVITWLLFGLRFGWKGEGLPGPGLLRRIITYSGWAFGANLFFFLVTRVDYWLLEWITGNRSSMGNYIQASRLVQLFHLFPAILAAAIFPLAASGLQQEMQERIVVLSRLINLAYLAAVALLLATGYWLFPFLFGPTFGDMYRLFVLLTPGLFALATLSLLSAYFAAINRVRYNLVISAAGLVLISTAGLLFIPSYGAMAAAVISSLGYLLCFTLGAFYFKRETGIGWTSFYSFKKADLAFVNAVRSRLLQPAQKTVT
ncbi:MAG TPA: polysaccharide biosynthesis C-terminal domain-containing protein [Lacibacter sp.]|nr:polysaccharide biosynthesis C-terminal domain-containing protein [Lacibacter sp.]HMO89686.1 polysaccharide biosynthesis C-terminal domain-containing protein [Lacibacter sp.]HMP87637.1 polysaccharide biosynthesis C-terminal domain-containing protein [Lacibacter sp.]